MARKKEKYFIRLESKTSNLKMIRDFVSKVANEAGFSDEDVSKIELAVDEASANVVKHAYPKKGRKIEIEVAYDPKTFEVRVRDYGKGFDPQGVVQPDMSEYLKQYSVGGLGIHLMKSLMDRVEYNINPGKCNQVTLIKNRK